MRVVSKLSAAVNGGMIVGNRPRQHRLAGTGRADHQQIVRPRRPLRPRLAWRTLARTSQSPRRIVEPLEHAIAAGTTFDDDLPRQ